MGIVFYITLILVVLFLYSIAWIMLSANYVKVRLKVDPKISSGPAPLILSKYIYIYRIVAGRRQTGTIT
jgi:hypothetical protein